ncbi:hypothetical protein MTR67_012963, partial [Solanum verrucosum]
PIEQTASRMITLEAALANTATSLPGFSATSVAVNTATNARHYDDIVIRMVHKALLRKFGVETQEVKNGQETATKELRDMHVDSLIMGMTSREKEEEEKSFVDVGLDYYYQKPLTIDVVHDLVEKINGNA